MHHRNFGCTKVLWDLDDCKVPMNLNPDNVKENIETAIWTAGYGSITEIVGYGDMDKLQGGSYSYRRIPISDCYESEERQKRILVDFLLAAIEPDYGLSVMVIVGDDISCHAGFLRAIRYVKSKEDVAVILAQPDVLSSNLLRHVTAAWTWQSLSCGRVPVDFAASNDSDSDIEQFVAADHAVFWDMEDCPIPDGVDGGQVAGNIRSALKAAGCNGSISIYGYSATTGTGDIESFGIVPKFYPGESYKKARLEKILVDLICCAIDNPGTTSFTLILGDVSVHPEFRYAIFGFLSLNYQCLVAQPRDAKDQLLHAVSTKWFWESLSRGGRPLFQES